MIYGVDFDGTSVMHEYPGIGEDVPEAVRVMKRMIERGDRIILWTMRDADELAGAVLWFMDRDIPLFGININSEQHWSNSPKCYCNQYIDDAAVGCPLLPGVNGGRPYVDWIEIEKIIFSESNNF